MVSKVNLVTGSYCHFSLLPMFLPTSSPAANNTGVEPEQSSPFGQQSSPAEEVEP
jgi:hypothetical protein